MRGGVGSRQQMYECQGTGGGGGDDDNDEANEEVQLSIHRINRVVLRNYYTMESDITVAGGQQTADC